MEQGLMRASDLVGPQISGTVNVTLAELDRMRHEHLQAVNVAKELEARQALIKITITQHESYTDFEDDYRTDRHGNKQIYQRRAITKQRLIDRDTIFINFDEIREPITEIEREKVQKHVSELQASTNKAIDRALIAEKTAAEVKRAADMKVDDLADEVEDIREKAAKEIEEIKAIQPELNGLYANAMAEIKDLEQNIAVAHTTRDKAALELQTAKHTIRVREDSIRQLQQELRKWQMKKSFWYYLTEKFKEKWGV